MPSRAGYPVIYIAFYGSSSDCWTATAVGSGGSSWPWACALEMRSQAMSKYLRSRSMPTNPRLCIAQGTPVLPLPMNGSSTVGALIHFRHHAISASGNLHGRTLIEMANGNPEMQEALRRLGAL